MSRPSIKESLQAAIATGSFKQLTVNLIDRILPGRGMQWDSRSFFTDMGGLDSDAGIGITNDKALGYTAFWACVKLLAETIASLPLHLYEQVDERNKKHAKNHPLYFLLHDEPNPEMDSFSYIESLMYHICAANGNAYSFIDWDESRTEIKALWPMNPDRVTKSRTEKGEIVYLYQSENGQIIIPAYRVWHVPGFGYDGLTGYTPLTYARNQIGLGLGAEKMGATLFKNGLTFGGFLEHPTVMTDQAKKNWEAQLKKEHEGVDKSHRVLILEEGMKYNKNNISPEDAQMLETRKYQDEQMARFFNVKPHMIGILEHATFSNIEEQSIEAVVYTFRPWLVRWERSINRQLLLPTEKGKYFAKFTVEGLLRGNTESRYRAHAIARNWGWESANDVLEIEDRNGIGAQGDIYLAPQNMMPADKFDEMLPKPPSQPPKQPAKT